MTDNSGNTNTEADQSAPEATANQTDIGPGSLTQKLQECREEAGMSLDDAAQRLRLSNQVLTALEAEDFDNLPTPPYVRGYLRSYSRLNNSDPQALINIYEKLNKKEDSYKSKFPPIRRENEYSDAVETKRGYKWFWWAILAAVIAGTAAIPPINGWLKTTWNHYLSQNTYPRINDDATENLTLNSNQTASEETVTVELAPKPAAPEEPSTAVTDAATNSPETETTEPVPEETAAVTAITTNIEQDSNTLETGADNVQATESPESTTANVDAEGSEITSTSVNESRRITGVLTPTPPALPVDEVANVLMDLNLTETGSSSTPDDDGNTTGISTENTDDAEATTEQAAPEPQPIDGIANVRLEFFESSWVQLRDRSGRILFERVIQPGNWRQFSAPTPVDIRLGNAAGVKMFVNSQPYDLKRHISGKSAKFILK